MISVGEEGRDGWDNFPMEYACMKSPSPTKFVMPCKSGNVLRVVPECKHGTIHKPHPCPLSFHHLPHFRPLSLPNEINWPVMEICYHFLPTIYAYQNIYMFSSHSIAFIYADDWPNLTSSTWSLFRTPYNISLGICKQRRDDWWNHNNCG